MATQNGARYLREQIDSILVQLSENDELIISDDCSSDNTVSIIRSYNDDRIKLYQNASRKGVAKNFETSLNFSTGAYIFLADQDDLWHPRKIEVMVNYLRHFDLVICDCKLFDHRSLQVDESFFSINNSGKGFLKNIVKNSYMGCCMGFNRKVLSRALPFPDDIPMHDFWIGLVGEWHGKVHFVPEVLVSHRRHLDNASTTGSSSKLSLYKKIATRYTIIKNLFFRKSYAG